MCEEFHRQAPEVVHEEVAGNNAQAVSGCKHLWGESELSEQKSAKVEAVMYLLRVHHEQVGIDRHNSRRDPEPRNKERGEFLREIRAGSNSNEKSTYQIDCCQEEK